MDYRSLVGGAIGDQGFEVGDIISVPPGKVKEWMAAGLIEKVDASPSSTGGK